MRDDAAREVAHGVPTVAHRHEEREPAGVASVLDVDERQLVELLGASDEALRSGEVIGGGLDGRVGWVGHGSSCDVGCRLVD